MEDVLRGKCTNVTNGQIMSTDCGQMRFATWKFFRCFWLGGGGAGGRIGCSREGLDKVTINHKQLTINHLPLTINYKLSTINQGLWKRSSTFGWTIPILMDLCCFQGEGSRYDQKKTSTSLHQGRTLHQSPHLTSLLHQGLTGRRKCQRMLVTDRWWDTCNKPLQRIWKW